MNVHFNRPPHSPFATRLSGSAKEVELRIRSILRGPQKRPPLWFLVLVFSAILSCGWLVSCQPMEKSQDSSSDSSLQEEDTSFVELMFQAIDSDILDTGAPIDKELLSAFTQDSYTLTTATFHDDYPRYILALGVRPLGGSELASPMFQADGTGGVPHVQQFMKDGRSYLLYTVNSARQGYSAGEAGVVTLDGPDLTWVWPVEGDIRDETSQAYADYQTFWEHRKALMAPGGVDVFVENEDFGPYEDSPPQWVPEFGESFYRTPEDELPIGVMYQTRVWLEDFSRHFNNPWDARNTSALWSIQSVTPMPYDGLREGEQAYRLVAQADDRDGIYFTADLILNEDNQVTQVIRWDQGSAQDVDLDARLDQDLIDRDQLILDYVKQNHDRVYFSGDEPGLPQQGDQRIDRVTYLGETALYETVGVAYQVEKSWYLTQDGSLDWQELEPFICVLSRSGYDGTFDSVLGVAQIIEGKPVKDVICEVAWGLSNAEVALRRDGYPWPAGPGRQVDFFNPAYGESETIEVLDGWEPIYSEGSCWARHSWPDFTALCYHDALEGTYSVNTIDTTRADLFTPRGIRVGSSRAEVLEAYPTAIAGNYWGKYPGEDMLYYIPGLDPETSDGFWDELGPAILFFFEGDTVRQITLTNMFN